MHFSFWLLLWCPFSFLLHNLIHEGAHYFACKAYGLKATLSILPRIKDGRVVFGVTNFELTGKESPKVLSEIFSAPLYSEILWFGLSVIGAHLVSIWWIKELILIEMVASLVDMTTWWLGTWTWRSVNGLTVDGRATFEYINVNKTTARVLSLFLTIPFYIAAIITLF